MRGYEFLDVITNDGRHYILLNGIGRLSLIGTELTIWLATGDPIEISGVTNAESIFGRLKNYLPTDWSVPESYSATAEQADRCK
jgi:hypothetical protein